ncbi:uncharacterized protein BO97DRAFT_417386 [Aspergillus homomorphus CBS 101889]|uniref:Uncharacterized protein n=1 Tax=Aspergillus homomorphus (strain CBS 101889) TaxID=1450537 RepID=A0A395HLA3_ASPHC|nr:hypothetical protein BO97DRAFT_417386 [Aspergillus homomorphus CBS 101889]RAL08712.1 hypothetical protein BO97DRAFT_417386 [Aspergillus homomorphus CBS 101889]
MTATLVACPDVRLRQCPNQVYQTSMSSTQLTKLGSNHTDIKVQEASWSDARSAAVHPPASRSVSIQTLGSAGNPFSSSGLRGRLKSPTIVVQDLRFGLKIITKTVLQSDVLFTARWTWTIVRAVQTYTDPSLIQSVIEPTAIDTITTTTSTTITITIATRAASISARQKEFSGRNLWSHAMLWDLYETDVERTDKKEQKEVKKEE